MVNEIILPDELVKYILFQRTGHLKYANAKLFKLLSKYTPWPIYEKMVAWEAKAKNEEVNYYGLSPVVVYWHMEKFQDAAPSN